MAGQSKLKGLRLSSAGAVALVLAFGACTAPGQPSAIAFSGCDTAFWPTEGVCWFSTHPMGQGINADPYRVVFRLKTPTVESITVSGHAATSIDPVTIPNVADTVFATAAWPYDEQAAPGQVAHLSGTEVTLAFPSSPPPAEGTSFDVVVTYRGWALGDTTASAQVARRFRFTRANPAQCLAGKPVVSAGSVDVGAQVKVDWHANGCKQAALTATSGTSGGVIGGGPGAGGSSIPHGDHVSGALGDAYAIDTGASSLSGSTSYQITGTKTTFTLSAWAWDGTRVTATSDAVVGTTPAASALPTPVAMSEFEFCATGPLGGVQLFWTATSEAAARQEIAMQYGGYVVSLGACAQPPLTGSPAPGPSPTPLDGVPS